MKFSEEHAFGMLIIRGRSDLAYHRDGEKDDNFKIGPIIFFYKLNFSSKDMTLPEAQYGERSFKFVVGKKKKCPVFIFSS